MVLGALAAGAAGGAVVSIVLNAIDNFSGVFALANKKLLLLGGAMTAVGVVGVGLIGGLVKIAGEFEQTNIAFTTMLGSAEKAEVLLKELADFAARTPFTITGVEQNAKQLLAMGISTEKLLPTLKSLGDVSAGLNVPLERIALNFGQVAVQGKLTGRELRDFSVAGIPLIAELSKNLGVTEAVIKEMVSAGDIGFSDVENAFTTMTSSGGKFFDLMDAQSKTFLGQVSNIQDSFIKLARVMGEVFLPIATFVAEKLAVLVGFFERHPTLLKFAAAGLAIVTILTLLAGVIILVTAVSSALAVVWSPITLIILGMVVAIGLLIAAGVFLIKHWDDIKRAAVNLGVGIQNVFIGIANIVLKVWNAVVDITERAINRLINKINPILSLIKRLTGIGPGKIKAASLGRFTAEPLEFKEFVPAPTQAATAGNTINIGTINGLSGKDIAKSLEEELGSKVQLG